MNKLEDCKKELHKKIKLNTIFIILTKGISVIISFAMMRISREFLFYDDLYGVWLTILSTMTWINLLDIGLGNGLRNKVAVEVAKENYKEAKKYVSTTYLLLFGIFLIGMTINIILKNFISWESVFNIHSVSKLYFNKFIFFMITINLVIFIVNIIKSICYVCK
ncbi:hypothetical protein R2R32_02760 [Clostridium perfringens]|nr:hypothetical protein [Clostridium perfringens]